MDLRLKEITWVRLLSLLLWTILVMLKRGITQLIEVIESRVFDVSEQITRRGDREELIGEATLLPPLSDELVLTRIWPLLHQRVNISLLWRLRRVNRAWRGKVGTTLESAALEMVRVDTPGFLQFLADRRERRPSLREWVESELESFAVLLTERLADFSSRVEINQLEIDHLVSVGSGENLSSAEAALGSASGEEARNCFCICREAEFSSLENFRDRDSDGCNWSEEEEFEAHTSSSGSSMRVYYPRHSLRVS